MQRVRRHLTYANVAATLALVIAVAGGATAIAGGKAAKNSVASSSIKPHNVTASDLAGIRVVQVTGQFSAFAPCSKGERLVGGGGSSVPAAVSDLAVSRPGNGGWLVQQSEGPDTLMAAYALCLKNKPGN
ncbi:MAG: hypothetical protein WB866_01140 [Solirubrobacterales bacterium]